jgi:N-acyl-L-homoserine lactone synthetase
MKVKVLNGDANHKPLVHAMMRQRARLFGPDGLNWAVNIVDGEERDLLDHMASPVYIVATDNDNVVGSLRLLPTTGPTLLDSSFQEFESIESPEIWEMSRLCAEGITRVFILLKMFDKVGYIAKKAEVTSIIGVVAPNTLSFLRRLGLPVNILSDHDSLLLISMPLNDTHDKVIELLDRG